ncbi:Flagellar synthesis regulator FleN [Candidatus Syntrophocurvum alkaliphilum]|uniref:Flagellar synthesis regulator FleN n=1 Tax=Candidatus Syntrophocurvum alkaliphilum TaxID=2293317 RepID=A0A6I6DD61_9FIRM|nr:MinD/ParA family protein [Candidatus Syntrophocurvum alkaliphilum]QGT99185.1 Flagellar synthesis regulator FleN [Candidatus Syntrophocurvum alkaliphilum]
MKDQADKIRQMALEMGTQLENELSSKILRSRVIVVASGKGGVGKSTLAINLALSICLMNKKVVLMDADLGLANIDIMLGITPNYNLLDVVQGSKSIKDIMVEGPNGLKLIPGGSGIIELANLKEHELKRLLIQMSSLDSEFDYMIVDTGAGISNNVLSFILSSDDVLIVTTPEPTSLTDAYGVVKSAVRFGFNGNIQVVINKVNNKSEGLLVGEKFKLVSEKFLDLNINILGHMVKEPMVEEGIKRQEVFIEAFPKSIATKNINNIAQKLVNENNSENKEVKAQGIKGFFKQLVNFRK